MDKTCKWLLRGPPTPTVATLRHLKNTPCSALKALPPILTLFVSHTRTTYHQLERHRYPLRRQVLYTAWCPTWLTVRPPELYHCTVAPLSKAISLRARLYIFLTRLDHHPQTAVVIDSPAIGQVYPSPFFVPIRTVLGTSTVGVTWQVGNG